MTSKALFVVYVLYCIEAGVFLVIYPWVWLWEQNAVLSLYPTLRPILMNNFLRGAVSGLGFANLLLGAWEIVQFPHYFKKA